MSPANTSPHKPDIVRTLVGAGFTILHAETRPSHLAVLAERTESLGVKARYAIAVGASAMNSATTAALGRWAEREGAGLVLVGVADSPPPRASVLSYDQFVDRLGGTIRSFLPLEPNFGERLRILGDNQLPKGLVGKPDELFESYVHAGLQFIFRSRVVRYGKLRSGEAVADGLATTPTAPLLLYDAKAAKGGYEMVKDEERKFEDYVREFHGRYEAAVGRLTAIVVISGAFADKPPALMRRFTQVLAATQVPLVFMDAATMAEIVAIMVNEPMFRPTVDWRLVFSEPIVRVAAVADELAARRRDGVLAV